MKLKDVENRMKNLEKKIFTINKNINSGFQLTTYEITNMKNNKMKLKKELYRLKRIKILRKRRIKNYLNEK